MNSFLFVLLILPISALVSFTAINPTQTFTFPTRTIITSTIQTTETFVQWIYPRRITIYSTITATTYHPILPSSLPTAPLTLAQKVVSHITQDTRWTFIEPPYGSSREVSYLTVTAPQVWIVHSYSPTHLTHGPDADCLSTPATAATFSEESPVCAENGMRTGCLGQCVLEKGPGGNEYWWCYFMRYYDWNVAELRMGRACWGNPGLRFRQLGEPCIQGDLAVGCKREGGKDLGWGAVNWEGEVAGSEAIESGGWTDEGDQ